MEKQEFLDQGKQIEENAKERLRKIMELPRNERRSMLRTRQVRSSSLFSRVRSGVPTGTTPHFRRWMAELGNKSLLQGMKLDAMADQLDGRLASTLALLRVSGGIRNVYQLSQKSVEELLSVSQVGPARLAEVEQYLTSKNVPLNWTAA